MGKVLAFLGVLAQAFACDAVYVPPCELGADHDQIFVGTVLQEGPAFGSFRFRIDEALKGIKPGIKEIEVGPGPCRVGYQAGKRYLILVRHLEADERGPAFTLGERAEDAAESISFFRALARGRHVTMIEGRIAENIDDSLARFEIGQDHRRGLRGVEIAASKDGRDYTATSDAAGSYSLELPESGWYHVAAKLAGHATDSPNYDINVAPDSCKELDLGMWTASRLTGRVTGPDGKPAEGIAVQLEPASEMRSFPPEAKTDAKGGFEFTNIPEGEYIVGVNLTGPNSKLPYDTRFYPGVSDRSAAGVVKITGPQTIEGLDFRIGERKPTRSIVVSVQWPDGRPVINASVACSSSGARSRGSRMDLVRRYVDTNGEATCEVLTDEDFLVDVDRLTWKASSPPIQPIATRPKLPVTPGTDTVRLRFVIDVVNDISAKEAPENMSSFNDQEF